MEKATVLMVPGLRDHVAGHWQTLLQASLPGACSVPPLTENGLSLQARVDAIAARLAQIEGPVVLVAHSAGVLMSVHWAARHGDGGGQVRGAVLATPPDMAAAWPPTYPSPETLAANGWWPLPRAPLPFPAIVAASSTDPLATLDAVLAMAYDWGSSVAQLGNVGHLNPAAGFGPWPQAVELLARLGQMAGVDIVS